MLIVPDELQRNAVSVHNADDPADTGAKLIDYMCRRIGIENLNNLDVLDFGCGVRFSQSIINRNVPVGSYTGIEVVKKIVDFLNRNVNTPKMSYHYVKSANNFYSPKSKSDNTKYVSQIKDKLFHLICMFSVITHQNPEEAAETFSKLRYHARPDGHMFFTAFVHEDDVDFQELNPARPGQKCSYSSDYLANILDRSGWALKSIEPANAEGLPMQTSILCQPKI